MNFSLVIPLWNEEANILELVRAISESGLPCLGMKELILVNNGSSDDTGRLIDISALHYSWILPVHLEKNHNYGGGVYEGFKRAHADIFCYIPGDLQVMPDDVIKVRNAFFSKYPKEPKLFTKGFRVTRHDPMQTRVVSRVYTFLANLVLDLRVQDVNGLPKMFHRDLIDLVPTERMKTFVFDTQILSLARINNWMIEEIPVVFHGRRQGISSWSQKRIRVYMEVFFQIVRLRALRHMPGVPLERT